jgi:hypothetical protein
MSSASATQNMVTVYTKVFATEYARQLFQRNHLKTNDKKIAFIIDQFVKSIGAMLQRTFLTPSFLLTKATLPFS